MTRVGSQRHRKRTLLNYGNSIFCGTVTDPPSFTCDKAIFARGGAVKGQTLNIIFLSCIIYFWNEIIHC
jgi:hypothetical protein